MAEGEGFEPPEGVNPQRFSRPPQSTALPPLQVPTTGCFLAAFAVPLNGMSFREMSVRVGGVLLVEDSLHLGEVGVELLAVGFPFLRRLLGHGGAHHVELLARGIGKH